MSNEDARPRRDRRWAAAAVLLAAVITAALGWTYYARTRAPSLDTPPPADLAREYTGDPNDLEKVGSYAEVRQYAQIARLKKSFTEAEFERVNVLAAHTKHTPTSMTAMIAGAAVVEAMNNPEPARKKFLDTVVANLKCDDTKVRRAALATLGNLKATDRTNAVLPFLKSNTPEEREAARSSLAKLGYNLPPAKTLGGEP